MELIRKKYDGELTEAEQRELTALHAAAEKPLQPFDHGRLKWLDQIEMRVEELAHADE